MLDLQLRRVGAGDLDIVLHHRREMFREMGFTGEEAFANAELLSREFFGRALSENNYHGWFYEDSSGEVVAGGGIILVEYHPSPRDARPRRPWVVNVYTSLQWRRRGLARRLMDVMIDWSREQGYSNLFLHASEEGRPLYEALGFAPTNEMRLKL
jgi:GNAT superfamily N-acetyltransferase